MPVCWTTAQSLGLQCRDPGTPNTGIPVIFVRYSNTGIDTKIPFSVLIRRYLLMIYLHKGHKIDNSKSLILLYLQLTDTTDTKVMKT
jgi:hypothetical protein